MIRVSLSPLAGTVSDYQLDIRSAEYFVRVYAASFCSSLLCFVSHKRPIQVPADFSLQISTSDGTKQVYPFGSTYFSLNNSMIHTLVFKNKTVMCIVPPSPLSKRSGAPIIKKRDCTDLVSSCSSLASSEEVGRCKRLKREETTNTSDDDDDDDEEKTSDERGEMRIYIRERYDNCDKLRDKIDNEGREYFYYNYSPVPVSWGTYHQFVIDCDCWCGKC